MKEDRCYCEKYTAINCKTGHFTTSIRREQLQNVQKYKMLVLGDALAAAVIELALSSLVSVERASEKTLAGHVLCCIFGR